MEGLGGVQPEPLAEGRAALYTGDYLVAEVGMTATVSEASGQLALALAGGATQPLVHTGEHRFRGIDGFIVFEVEDGRARALTYVRDGGGVRRAERR